MPPKPAPTMIASYSGVTIAPPVRDTLGIRIRSVCQEARLAVVTRLTRAESQARTRTQLLRTARELFLRDGYLATSLDKVAEDAGFSKGAVYSNFRRKDELCLAVLDEIRAERAAEIAGLLAAPDADERLRRFEEWAERVIGDPQWTALEFEFAVQARRDPA